MDNAPLDANAYRLVLMAEAFGEIEPLIAAFERGECWTVSNPQARKLIADKLRGRNRRGRKRTFKQFEHEFNCAQKALFYAAYKDIPEYEKAGTKVTGCSIVGEQVNQSADTIAEYVDKHRDSHPARFGQWLRKYEAKQVDCDFATYMAERVEKSGGQLDYENRIGNAWRAEP